MKTLTLTANTCEPQLEISPEGWHYARPSNPAVQRAQTEAIYADPQRGDVMNYHLNIWMVVTRREGDMVTYRVDQAPSSDVLTKGAEACVPLYVFQDRIAVRASGKVRFNFNAYARGVILE